MHIKKFLLIFFTILVLGLIGLSFNSIIFVSQSSSTTAKVMKHQPGEIKNFYKLGGNYKVQTLNPIFSYIVNQKSYELMAPYSCEDGCHQIGSIVTLYYLKKKPETVLISSFEGMWKYQVYFFILMTVLLFSSLPYLYYNINKQPLS